MVYALPMTIHLLKLCVGAGEVEDLADWQARLMRHASHPYHRTRMVPRRATELLDGGSIYWVIRGAIRVRQPILDVRVVDDETGRPLCELVFDPTLIPTERQPRKPFQGWRYLKPADAPADRSGRAAADVPADLGEALKAALVW